MSRRPWYDQGLRFECTLCGRCCTGEPGYVWVDSTEITALAKRLKMAEADFEAAYVRRVVGRKSLIERANGDCVFYDRENRGCVVYPDRPRQCHTWPFWKSTVGTPEDWEETCRACPGCGRGAIVDAERITALVRVIEI